MPPETLELLARYRAEVAAILDDLTDEVLAVWAAAWRDIYEELTNLVASDTWETAAGLERGRLLASAEQQAANRVLAAAQDSSVIVTDGAKQLITRSVTEQATIIGTQLPAALKVAGFARPAGAALDEIVARTTQQITARHYALSVDATAAMKRALVTGTAAGDNPRVVARRMIQQTQDAFNGGVARAQTIARTEMISAHRAAAKSSHEANKDVLNGWIWMSALTERSCIACVSMHGSVHELEEDGPQGHQNCRCARVPQSKTWAELGFPGVEETRLEPETGAQWFAKQSDETQRKMLGPARYAAWKEGQYPPSAWAVLKQNPGWRPSYNVSSVPD